MAAVFPTIPKIVMCYIEPLTLLAGILAPTLDSAGFITSQVPTLKLAPGQAVAGYVPLATEKMLALQLANVFGLAMLVGVGVLNTTTEARVVHAYVFALWAADIGHLLATGYVMGLEDMLDVGGWNATTWGNVGITTALFAVRSLYFLGVFGPDREPRSAASAGSGRKQKSK